MPELTASFEELAAQGVKNFAAAGRLFLAAATRPTRDRPLKAHGGSVQVSFAEEYGRPEGNA